MFNEQHAHRPEDDENEGYEMEDSTTNGGLRSRFGRWVGQLTGRAATEEDENYEDAASTLHPVSGGTPFVGSRTGGARSYENSPTSASSSAKNSTFRIASAREGSISVMPVTTFADVQKAADRLKAGEPQIINLEKTDADSAERLIDFLNGVTYALDGSVEKVAEGAYLFTPSHISINAEGNAEAAASRSKTFFDRIS
ncbi:MAG: cell division protein SepF [Cytophagales bacterium]|nr:cell division protein SepF [Armatimonadota bacterium]